MKVSSPFVPESVFSRVAFAMETIISGPIRIDQRETPLTVCAWGMDHYIRKTTLTLSGADIVDPHLQIIIFRILW